MSRRDRRGPVSHRFWAGRRGLTLFEVLLAVALLVLVAAIATSLWQTLASQAERAQQTSLRQLREGRVLGALAESLGQVVAVADGRRWLEVTPDRARWWEAPATTATSTEATWTLVVWELRPPAEAMPLAPGDDAAAWRELWQWRGPGLPPATGEPLGAEWPAATAAGWLRLSEALPHLGWQAAEVDAAGPRVVTFAVGPEGQRRLVRVPRPALRDAPADWP